MTVRPPLFGQAYPPGVTCSLSSFSVPALDRTLCLPCGVPSTLPSAWDRIGGQHIGQTGLAQGWAPLAFLVLTLAVVEDSL